MSMSSDLQTGSDLKAIWVSDGEGRLDSSNSLRRSGLWFVFASDLEH